MNKLKAVLGPVEADEFYKLLDEQATTVELRAAGTGRLIALPVVEGDLVEADQILAQVDAKSQNAAICPLAFASG